MENAILFDHVMRALWDDGHVEAGPGYAQIKAIVSYVKTHVRINPENALDVLDIMWPESVFMDAVVGQDLSDDGLVRKYDEIVYTIKMPDGSSVILVSKRGIASELEVI
jgi:hypothetical protein